MSGFIGGLGDIAESSASQAVAFGLGFALGAALEPAGTELRQEAWKLAPIRAPEAQTLAEGVAQGQVDPGAAKAWAAENGYGDSAWNALVSIADTGPALGYAYQAWRRGFLSDDEFTTALRRTGLEVEWNHAMEQLKNELLDPGAIATAIHRGIIAAQGLLIQEPPQGAGKIPFVQQSNIDGVAEAAGHGIDQERLRVLVGNTGLPLSLGEMLQLLNRGEVTEDDVRRSVAQSNVRNEYMNAALALRRRLLTPHEYQELALRGWISEQEADAGSALSGMEAADAQLLFKMLGRPLNVHAITTAIARGGKYGGDYEGVPEPYQTALRQSNVRPEWGNMAHANRYSYPSAFVIRSLATGGELDEATTKQTLLEIGWPPDLTDKVVSAWYGATTTSASKFVTKAEGQVWTAIHKAYVNDNATDAQATADLEQAGVATADVPNVLKLWQVERGIVRRNLTAKQIVNAIGQPNKDQAWALERLTELGYSTDDANTLLNE